MNFSKIKNQIIKAQKETRPFHYAAFDADGTLWNFDVLLNFLEYQIKMGLLCSIKARYLWQKLISEPSRKEKNLIAIANLFSGLTVKELRKRALSAYKDNPAVPFPEQKKLIKWLQERGIKVYIVSASYKWALEPAVKALGLPVDSIIAVENEVKNGVVTKNIKGHISVNKGKEIRLFEKTKKKNPILAAGNTLMDWDLIETSSHVKLAVSCKSCFDRKLLKLEKKLQKIGKKEGWVCYEFA